MLIQVAAMDRSRCIGRDGEVPFDLADDRVHFRLVTQHYGTTCAGRKTQEGVLKKLKRPLPLRRNLVLSRNVNLEMPGCEVITNFREVVEMARETDICIIGGGEIYKLFLPYSQKLILTHVDAVVEGDTFFPEIDPNEWYARRNIETGKQIPGRNEFSFTVTEYIRRPRT